VVADAERFGQWQAFLAEGIRDTITAIVGYFQGKKEAEEAQRRAEEAAAKTKKILIYSGVGLVGIIVFMEIVK
jgi:uncharacterized membrane protein YgcG